jgi:hypothetical protein
VKCSLVSKLLKTIGEPLTVQLNSDLPIVHVKSNNVLELGTVMISIPPLNTSITDIHKLLLTLSILNTCQKDNIPVKEKPSLTILEMVLKMPLMVFPDIVMLKTQLSQLKTLLLVVVQMITSVGN